MNKIWHTMRTLAKKFANLSIYWRVVISPYRKEVVILLGLGLLGSLAEVSVLGITVPILDVVSHPERLSTNRIARLVMALLQRVHLSDSTASILFTLILSASLLFLMRGIFQVAEQYWEAMICLDIKQKTRSMLFAKTLRISYELLGSQSRGAILNDIVQPSDSVGLAIKNLGVMLTGLINIVALVALMFYLSRWGTLFIGAVGMIGVFAWRRYLNRLTVPIGTEIFEIQRSQSKIEVDAIDGIRVVKANVIEPVLAQQHRERLMAEVPLTMRVTLFRNGPTVVNELIACIILTGLGALTFFFPTSGLRFSTFVVMLLAVRRMSPAISQMNASSVELAKWYRGLEVLEETRNRQPEQFGLKSVPCLESVSFKNINFRYATKSVDALSHVSFVLKRGTVTALVGPTGSGKSTIANLLLGFYLPREGAILINSELLSNLNLATWRNKVGYVSQDVFLFNATIEENISLWNSSLSLGDVRKAAQIAQLDEYIMSLPTGYKTVVGDRGLRLSGGQCQRVALARAVLRSPELLILDEATSALDNLTEKAVYRAIESYRKQAIVLVIAHRLSTVRSADQIIVIKNGMLIEAGRHDDLLAQEGDYAALYAGEIEQMQSPP